jgi:hypothetical protein
MQSCHIVVAVRLKTRMAKLRKRRRAACDGAISAGGANAGMYTEPDGSSVCYFTIGKTSEALSWMGSCGSAYANSAIRPSANPP